MDLKKKLQETESALKKSLERQQALEESLSRQSHVIREEQEKTTSLLMNIFPEKIVAELLAYGKVKARYYNNVSVLFADIESFSSRSTAYSPVELVEMLDVYFGEFDRITGSLGLEKIKTIGDCYMCAGGLPEEDHLNPYKVVLAGLWMQESVARLAREAVDRGRVPFHLRLGIHTGEAVAGVVGSRKYAYDIWGKAANMASLMVHSGEIKKVNISSNTHEAVCDAFRCTFRGKILTKKKAVMSMYFVERLRPEYSADASGLLPNNRFLDKVRLRPPENLFKEH
jgi:class 3 adenylate cyclase